MSRRGAVLIAMLLTAVAVAGPASPAPAATAGASAKAKKCKKGFVKKKGRCVCPKGRTRRGAKCVVVKKKVAGTPTPTPGAPSPGAPTTPGPTDGPPFAPPGRDLTGTEAANKILPFLANSTFTDCVTGWPTCAVEERYGHFADATLFYCRLTSSSGSDIINGAAPFQIIGADQKADGSWAVTTQIASYGNTTYYTWTVSTTGVTTGLYWGPGSDPRVNAPTQSVGPLQWVRGARNCSY